MSNGHACCILGVCCPPVKQRAALAEMIKASLLEEVPEGPGVREDALAATLAEQLLGAFDLAPKGLTAGVMHAWGGGSIDLADAVRPLYAPLFAEAAQADG